MRIPILKTFSILFLLSAFLWSCQKEYSLEGSLIKLPAGTWQFNDSTKLFRGNMDTAYIDTTAPTRVLHLLGTSTSGNESFSINLFSIDSFQLGTYRASLSQSEFDYFSLTSTIYQGGNLTGEFLVTVTQLSNGRITGVFSGLVVDSAGNSKNITLGKFTTSIKLKTSGTTTGATGTLGTIAGNCSPITASGIFTQGIALDPTNTIQVQVTVTQAGAFNLSTNTINGVTFTKAGSFASTGVQNVVLTGTGMPVNAGPQTFTVTMGSTACNFNITFLTGIIPPPVLDYFPITLNSNWIYYYGATGLPGYIDSNAVKITSYNPTFAGNSYTSFESNTTPPTSPIDTQYFRKTSGNYYQYIDAANIFPFTNSSFGEYIFLKDNVAQGATWQSQNFSGNISGVGLTSGYITMTLLAKAVPVTIGSLTFPDVIKVKYDYFLMISPGVPISTEEKWFARGVGLIHDDIDTGNSFSDIIRYTIY